MASISISASLQIACSCNNVIKNQQTHARTARSLGSKQATSDVVTLNVEGQKCIGIAEQQEKSALHSDESKNADKISENVLKTEYSVLKFINERWKKGTWDLNMFVKDGRMDWDALIEAGRAAMVGFFAAYVVDGLTGLDMVGQTGNLICKAGLFVTVISIILFRRSEDLANLRTLADEATFYDKQWQASWKDQDAPSSSASEKTSNIL